MKKRSKEKTITLSLAVKTKRRKEMAKTKRYTQSSKQRSIIGKLYINPLRQTKGEVLSEVKEGLYLCHSYTMHLEDFVDGGQFIASADEMWRDGWHFFDEFNGREKWNKAAQTYVDRWFE